MIRIVNDFPSGLPTGCCRRPHTWLALAIFAVGFSPVRGARADASPSDKAAAQSLFDEGRRLVTEAKFAEACPKFAESQRLDPGVGTEYNLADCYERVGQTASAWAVFLEVASLSKQAGQFDRERVARQRAADLVPRLSTVTIVPSTGEMPQGTEIRKDGELIGRALWGTAIPVDPGTHGIDVIVPAKAPWHADLDVKGNADRVTVTIPAATALADQPPAPQTQGRQPELQTPTRKATRPAVLSTTLGITVGVLAVAGLGVGSVLALAAKRNKDDSLGHCRPTDANLCDATGVDLRSRARSQGDAATVAFALGAAALTTEVALMIWGGSRGPSSSASIVVSPNLTGATLRANF